MMADSTFGTKLASERIRRGLTLEQVSSTLRIRPAILESLETGDFYHMPLKGHARNMVSSYARYLGLDPIDLTEQFLKEYHDFEEDESRQAAASRRAVDTPDYHSAAPDTSAARSASVRRRSSSRSQGMRSMWDKPIPPSPQHQALEKRSNASRPLTTRRTTAALGEGGPRRTRRTAADAHATAGGTYGNAGSYTPAKPPLFSRILGTLFKSPVTAIVVLVVVLILLLVLWALAANSCSKKTDENVPASGGAVVTEEEALDPNTGLEIPDLSDDLLPDPRYGPFQLTVEPAPGTTPWTEVTVDGQNVFAGMLDGRVSWEVTDSCEISTGQPGNLTVKRDDAAVEISVDEDGIGHVNLEVEERPPNDRTTNAPTNEGDTSGTSGTDATGEE
jgi:hypothetical protein